MTDAVVVQEIAANEVVLVFQPGGAVAIPLPTTPDLVVVGIGTPGPQGPQGPPGTGTGTGATPGGSPGYVQYHGGIGAFAGVAGFQFDDNTIRLTVSGGLNLSSSAPKSWHSGYTAIDLNSNGFLFANGLVCGIGSNLFYEGVWKYKAAGSAIAIQTTIAAGGASLDIYTAPNGVADAQAILTQQVSLNAAGVLSVRGAIVAPRALIAPTALGTVQDSALEYDGAKLWFTIGSTRTQVVPATGGAGTQGPQGTQGTAGSAGGTGPQGPQGAAGSAGTQGPQGPQGALGLTGVGTQGAQGPQGTPGPQGLSGGGPQGPQGSPGLQGPQGTVGSQGLAGSGTQGPQGVAGSAGTAGTQGPQGAAGSAGGTGPQGAAGTPGAQGPQGAQGSTVTTLSFVIDGAGAPLTTGVKFDLPFDFACTLNMVTLLADQAGSLSLDIWKNTYANYPPIAGNSICGSTKPTLGNVIKSQDGVLFGWNKTINAGDVLRFNVDSAATLTRVSVSLRVTRV